MEGGVVRVRAAATAVPAASPVPLVCRYLQLMSDLAWTLHDRKHPEVERAFCVRRSERGQRAGLGGQEPLLREAQFARGATQYTTRKNIWIWWYNHHDS